MIRVPPAALAYRVATLSAGVDLFWADCVTAAFTIAHLRCLYGHVK